MIYVASFINEYDYDIDVRRDNLGEDAIPALPTQQLNAMFKLPVTEAA